MKRKTAEIFYKLHNKISNPKVEENVGDFRLMSRQVIDAIKKIPERKLLWTYIGLGVASFLCYVHYEWRLISLCGKTVSGYPLMTSIFFS